MSDPAWRLILGDCLDPVTGLASLADKSVDHVITDPPYSARLYTRTRTNKGSGYRSDNGRRISARNDEGSRQDAQDMADLRIGAIDSILNPVADELLRLSRRWIVVFHDVECGHRWRERFGEAYIRAGAWVKPNPMPQVTGDRPAQGFEPATIAHAPGKKRWNAGGKAALWIHSTAEPDRPTGHPCPKPLSLMEELVRDFTDPGDLVIDPFAGSGTTGVAAIRLGRRFIGWEKDPKYYEIARKRLEGTREQLSLLEKRPKPKQESLLK
jgi:site-specific DNA-methyltransferase (adenine-specific)